MRKGVITGWSQTCHYRALWVVGGCPGWAPLSFTVGIKSNNKQVCHVWRNYGQGPFESWEQGCVVAEALGKGRGAAPNIHDQPVDILESCY